MPNNTVEIWKGVAGHEDSYQVSNLGRVKSLARRVRLKHRSGTESTRSVPERILKPGMQLKSGHVSVAIGKNNSRLVHQLVLEAFVGPRPKGYDTLHLNHIANDNRLENLRYGTRSENVRMDYAAGTRTVHPNFNPWGYRYD